MSFYFYFCSRRGVKVCRWTHRSPTDYLLTAQYDTSVYPQCCLVSQKFNTSLHGGEPESCGSNLSQVRIGHTVMEQFYLFSLVLTGLKGPIIRDAMPFPSKLLACSSFFSPSFFTGGIPCDLERTKNNINDILKKNTDESFLHS